MKVPLIHQTRKGAASLYVVVFATILFGVITLSFVRLMISESSQTTDEDLSQSAYDAALAGVEDAKVAASQYYTCLKNNPGNTSSCGALFGGSCSDHRLSQYLYGSSEEVKIQESAEHGNTTEQAYTCVLLSNRTVDYLGVLDSATRIKVIPLGVDDMSVVSYIRFSWYTAENGTQLLQLNHGGKLKNSTESTIPPAIALSVISSKNEIELANFGNDGNGRYATVFNLPSDTPDVEPSKVGIAADQDLGYNFINKNELDKAADLKKEHQPYQVRCFSPVGLILDEEGEPVMVEQQITNDDGTVSTYSTTVERKYACVTDIDVSAFKKNDGQLYLIASMPYGVIATDFKVEVLDKFGQPINLTGVQVSVDSTGRANDLYRRVETRLSPSDDYYPYPQFELDLGDADSSGAATLDKNFWITNNCWTESGQCGNNSR